jgi:ATP-dependent DNA helicase DinG
MGLQDAVERAFDTDGPLASSVAEFRPRPGQTVMAREVARAMESGGVLAVEAGTGVGKTFAYLVPALLSGERVLLSTATKALQDQLFGRDIPRLAAVLGLPVRAAMLKGRSSYLCVHRLESARHDVQAGIPLVQRDLARIEAWSAATRSGDLAELVQLDDRSPVIPLVTSTRENCLGGQCPKVHVCHVNLARREAMDADVVVINHHLFFADLNVRESGVAELLPTVTSVVFDEAHQLNEIGVQFLGRQLTTGQLDGLRRDIALQGPQLALGSADWRQLLDELGDSITSLRDLCSGGESDRWSWFGDSPLGVPPAPWADRLAGIHSRLQLLDMTLRNLEESSPVLKGLRERTGALMSAVDLFASPMPPGFVRWLESGKHIRLVQSPLDIAQTMQTRVIGQEPAAGSRKSWIFTSATLGSDASMSWFLESCGLKGAQVLHVESPFDYAVQAAMYIPAHMPKPSDPSHSACVALLVARGAEILRGRTLVLTTSLRAMRTIGEALHIHFPPSQGIEVLVQGQAPKRELIERFCGAEGGAIPKCILIASFSFWEGIDVPGDALQMVVIDKLPFASPGDPLVEARARQVESLGRSPFQHYHLPQAAIALRQGAGRLIRRETDRGVLVVCDVRLSQMAYGRRMQAALPAMQAISNDSQFEAALLALTRTSTKDSG